MKPQIAINVGKHDPRCKHRIATAGGRRVIFVWSILFARAIPGMAAKAIIVDISFLRVLTIVLRRLLVMT